MNWTDLVDLGIRVSPRKIIAALLVALWLVFLVAPSAGQSRLHAYGVAKIEPLAEFLDRLVERVQTDAGARANDSLASVGSPFQRPS